jgi:hypothetical protein
MLNETHRAPPRYKISDFFSSLLGEALSDQLIRWCCIDRLSWHDAGVGMI